MEEARAIVFFKHYDNEGQEENWTLRSTDENDLLNRVREFKAVLKTDSGTTPPAQKKAEKPQLKPNLQKNLACPECGSPLVEFKTKDGRTHLKCSTAGWDNVNKKATGCSYVKWSDDEGGVKPRSGNEATPAQKKVITNNWPELWRDGLTKAEAVKIIDENKNW